MAQFETDLLLDDLSQLSAPPLYKVLLHNDDFTPMDFVVEVIQKVFHKSKDESTDLMYKIHFEGLACCGIYPYEIAKTKAFTVEQSAENQEYPLRCSIEADEL